MSEHEIWAGWGSVIIASGTIITFSLIAAVLVWQAFRTWQTSLMTKAMTAREAAFQTLVQEQMDTQKKLAEEQRVLSESLASVRESLNSIERILKAVD